MLSGPVHQLCHQAGGEHDQWNAPSRVDAPAHEIEIAHAWSAVRGSAEGCLPAVRGQPVDRALPGVVFLLEVAWCNDPLVNDPLAQSLQAFSLQERYYSVSIRALPRGPIGIGGHGGV